MPHEPPMPLRRILRCVPLFALAAAGATCTPFKIDPGGDAGSSSSNSAPASHCAHREPPERPNVTDAGGTMDLIFAASNWDIGAQSQDDAGRPLYRTIGFDLDHTCSGEGVPSCVRASWATAVESDGVDGIDNAFGQAWWDRGLGAQVVTGETPAAIIRVKAYSGEPDDDQVQVSLYVGLGLAPREDGGDAGSDPLWDGKDKWNILPEMLASSADGGTAGVDEPLFRDDQAYVSGGVLVARFADVLWSAGLLSTPTALVHAHRVILAGSLSPVGATWDLQNLVMGFSIRLTDILIAAGRLIDPMVGKIACLEPSTFRTQEKRACSFADIASVPGSPSAACDALSVGILSQAKPAGFGEVRDASPPLPECAPGVHPETDTCDSLADGG
jgi:hypothetical protein